MSGHTDGPWEYVPPGRPGRDGDKGKDMGGFYSATGYEVCWFGDKTTYYPCAGTPPNEADARLIAAAPKMLAVLEQIFMMGYTDFGDRIMVEDAIELATGRGPTYEDRK